MPYQLLVALTPAEACRRLSEALGFLCVSERSVAQPLLPRRQSGRRQHDPGRSGGYSMDFWALKCSKKIPRPEELERRLELEDFRHGCAAGLPEERSSVDSGCHSYLSAPA